MMLLNRVSKAQLLQCRVAVSASFLRPLICYAAAEATPEAATTSFRAIVTLDNNVKGRLHVNMISKERVEAVGDVFSVGDELKAVVVSTNNDTEVQLSTKALELVPGQMKTDKQILITDISQQSAVATATTRISPLKAIVTLDNNVKGRLHVSMISKERVEAVGDVFSVGDKLKVGMALAC
ncbi:30S ribosomal protein S1 [Haematococcus lacustris]|uniref:30S ribosomal protein S1 n=1 Tax=Haematococcus lacustris TaxID=44745 RepID=A0A699ZMK8_HAELA|nr:30S ribosomal protein S1 [Haematococcus lacustris]